MASLNAALLFVLSFAVLIGCDDKVSIKVKDQSVILENAPKSMSEIYSGYQSDPDAWIRFLKCWRSSVNDRLYGKSDQGKLPEFQLAAPGTDKFMKNAENVAALEASLRQRLPKSYIDFLLVSGGSWFVENIGYDYAQPGLIPSHFLPISAVDFFKKIDLINWVVWSDGRGPEFVPPEDYYLYGPAEPGRKMQDSALYKSAHLDYLLKIGELEQGVTLLLNPLEITKDGEWEAWLLSPQVGAVRYRSFAEMMFSIYYEDAHPEEGGLYISPEKLVGTCAGKIKTMVTP